MLQLSLGIKIRVALSCVDEICSSRKQVRSDNDASKLDILGQFERIFDEWGWWRTVFLVISDHFFVINGSMKMLRTDGRTDPLKEMRGRISKYALNVA